MISETIKIFEIFPTEHFEENIEYLVKKKRYRKLPSQIGEFVSELEAGKLVGSPLQNMNISSEEVVYKVRMANNDTKSGKSNGYRIIYYVQKMDKVIALLTIYYKKEQENISDDEIKRIIKAFCEDN